MIDIANDNLIRIDEVPKRLPKRPKGKRIHISAVYRWIRNGVRGVKLEAVKIGGTMYTSEEALQRFAEQLSIADHTQSVIPVTTKTRERQIEKAAKRVDELLGDGK